jgi:hypothetical protein
VIVGGALALPLLASLVAAAGLSAELGASAEGRSTTHRPEGLPNVNRTALSLSPNASVVADAGRLRLTATYAPRFWTADVERRTSPLVDHELHATLETNHARPWHAEATVDAIRGYSDPLSDPRREAAPTTPVAVATAAPFRYQDLEAGVGGLLKLDPRTAVAATASWRTSRAVAPEAAPLLPLSRAVALDASLSWRATERDTLLVEADASLTTTASMGGEAGGDADTRVAGGVATWRRRLSPRDEVWIGGGVTYSTYGVGTAPSTSDVLPEAEIGATVGEGTNVKASLTAQLTTFVDRLTGEVSPMTGATGELAWRRSQRLSLLARALGAATTDGRTALAASDVRAVWVVRDRLELEGGLRGFWQHERRPGIPSFVEAAAFVGASYATRRQALAAAPPGADTASP